MITLCLYIKEKYYFKTIIYKNDRYERTKQDNIIINQFV